MKGGVVLDAVTVSFSFFREMQKEARHKGVVCSMFVRPYLYMGFLCFVFASISGRCMQVCVFCNEYDGVRLFWTMTVFGRLLGDGGDAVRRRRGVGTSEKPTPSITFFLSSLNSRNLSSKEPFQDTHARCRFYSGWMQCLLLLLKVRIRLLVCFWAVRGGREDCLDVGMGGGYMGVGSGGRCGFVGGRRWSWVCSTLLMFQTSPLPRDIRRGTG